jgi:hypothetical protein
MIYCTPSAYFVLCCVLCRWGLCNGPVPLSGRIRCLRTNSKSNWTNFIGKSPSWEASSCSANQEIPCILWNPKVHYRVHKSLPPAPVLSQMNSVHIVASYFYKIHSNIILPLTLRSSKWSLSFGFFYNNFVCISHLPSPPPPWASRVLHALTILIMHFLQPPVTCCPVSLNILLSTLFWNTLNLDLFPQVKRLSLTPIQKNRQNYIFIYFNLCMFRYQRGKQKILNWTVASIPRI